ncbi:hypothetical protein JQ596_29895 [Bradyrhizobium manausense]|uniref:hypothetical protein n=1 Tax=Bradyrhizobium TaxID=374 RepID=UPI001BAC080D|nr:MULTISPECIES: hypothetical protein [Bradyrhizobium]MBR0829753.1 hypothetical protein [Bradyrhizobium manausense]UVO25365.1 hypothetical protein KUF59_22430 [Bradyrhizobium arachidis]
MRNTRGSRHSLVNTQKLTIIAQDPSVRIGGKILMSEVDVPAEELLAGPRGYRVNVIDFDTATSTLYRPAVLKRAKNGQYEDAFALKKADGTPRKRPKRYDHKLVSDPTFHAQNVYAIVMRTLAQFEFALGRRVPWGSQGHQIHVAPHAFADANAFYSREHRGIFFGYFTGPSNRPIFTCLSHDIVAHETTHAILDGIRSRYLEPSSPDQAAFHEGFADIIALLSIFSLPDLVGQLLDRSTPRGRMISKAHLTADALKQSVLLGLAEEMGVGLSKGRESALRRSVKLRAGRPYMSMPEFSEEHDRGELLVAAMMNAFLEIWMSRLAKIGFVSPGKRDRSLVVEEGARAAGHLLTMSIRALDYCPPTDITFADYLSALLTVDREVVPDDKYRYRAALLRHFNNFDIRHATGADVDGLWKQFDGRELVYARTHFDSMLRDKEEVFRFIWENRKALDIDDRGYVEVQSVRPSIRIGPDGFTLRETVAEYVQIMTLQAKELKAALKITPPPDLPPTMRIRIFGGGALIFNEYGQLKYKIANRIEDAKRQTARLKYLWESGALDGDQQDGLRLARLHRARMARAERSE